MKGRGLQPTFEDLPGSWYTHHSYPSAKISQIKSELLEEKEPQKFHQRIRQTYKTENPFSKHEHRLEENRHRRRNLHLSHRALYETKYLVTGKGNFTRNSVTHEKFTLPTQHPIESVNGSVK